MASNHEILVKAWLHYSYNQALTYQVLYGYNQVLKNQVLFS